MGEFKAKSPTSYKAEDYLKMTASERRNFNEFIKNQIAYNQSLAAIYDNQAKSFREEKEKITYERADKRYIPFLAYCWRIAFTAISGSLVLFGILFRLPLIDESQMNFYTILATCITIILVLALFLPLRILPKIKGGSECSTIEK